MAITTEESKAVASGHSPAVYYSPAVSSNNNDPQENLLRRIAGASEETARALQRMCFIAAWALAGIGVLTIGLAIRILQYAQQ